MDTKYCNGFDQSIARQQLGKHVPTHAPRNNRGSCVFYVSETVKYVRQSQRTRTRERLRWQGPAACTNDRPVLSSEWTPHKKTRP
jgi:hypothetical protein